MPTNDVHYNYCQWLLKYNFISVFFCVLSVIEANWELKLVSFDVKLIIIIIILFFVATRKWTLTWMHVEISKINLAYTYDNG